MKRTSGQKAHAAIHETAHAVARIRFGGWVQYVTLIPQEDADQGHMLALDAGGDLDGEALAICALAGYAAEVHAGGDDAQAKQGARSDFEKARAYLAGCSIEAALEQVVVRDGVVRVRNGSRAA